MHFKSFYRYSFLIPTISLFRRRPKKKKVQSACPVKRSNFYLQMVFLRIELCANKTITRMHSSRMRTGRSLTVCQSLLLGGGVCFLGGCLLLGGLSASCGGVCFWGVCSRGVSAPVGCLLQGGLLLGGCLLLGCVCSGRCVCSRGVSAPGGCGIPTCTEANTPLWTESLTPVKTLPWPQLRCGR